MKRLAIGAALGGLAVYLYDPQLGEDRRGRLSSLWQENRNAAQHAARTTSETIDSARPLAHRITKAIGRGNLPLVIDRGRPVASLTRLVAAAAFGGTVVYFMDPLKGSARRLEALGAGRRAFRQFAKVVRPVRGRIGDQVTNAVQRTHSKVS